MIDISNITDLNTEEVNHISSAEPTETYFKAFITEGEIEGEGIGETEIEAIISAIDDIENIKLNNYESLELDEEEENIYPF